MSDAADINKALDLYFDAPGLNSAIVKVEASVKPRDLIDYLTLLEIDGRWKIISRTYHFTEEVG